MNLSVEQIADAMGAEIVARGGSGSPDRAAIDSREAGPGVLFFGLRGESAHGGEFAPAAIESGAWGVVVTPEQAAGRHVLCAWPRISRRAASRHRPRN